MIFIVISQLEKFGTMVSFTEISYQFQQKVSNEYSKCCDLCTLAIEIVLRVICEECTQKRYLKQQFVSNKLVFNRQSNINLTRYNLSLTYLASTLVLLYL